MKKKLVVSSIILFLFLGLIYFSFEIIFSSHDFNKNYCPFCDRKVIEYQKYFEDDKVIGLCTYKPVSKGHCLIIPKRHVERFENLTDDEVLSLSTLIKKTQIAAEKIINTDSYLILQKNGKSVGQSVPHLHFHYIPRNADEKFLFTFFLRLAINPFTSKLSPNEMKEITTSFTEGIQNLANEHLVEEI